MDPAPASSSTGSRPSSPSWSRHSQRRFRIATRKCPISTSATIDALADRIGIPMPEMIFGHNAVAITHAPSGWTISFDAPDALDAVDKTDRHMLKVAYARDWESTREAAARGIKEVVKPYDWSYSTTYCGTLAQPAPAFAPTEEKIPVELLKRRDPILFFDHVVLYESELDDNGISICSVKVRVHDERMLLLCRLFMRLDDVVVRIRDTRLYIDFLTDRLIREYTAKEASFEHVKKALLMEGRQPDELAICMRDPNLLDPMLALVEQRTEAVSLKT